MSEEEVRVEKYLLFSGDPYEVSEGGFEDLIGSYDTIIDAELEFEANARAGDWGQIVEHSTMELVKELEKPCSDLSSGNASVGLHYQKYTRVHGVMNIIKYVD